MVSRTGNWMLAAGGFLAFLGLCALPGAFGQNGDHTLLGLGTALFGLGALTMAAGFYFKANALKGPGSKKSSQDSAASARPIRGGCDRCQVEAPVIHCKVHQQHLCGSCLAEHYEFRSCVYVPSTRRTAAVKAMAAKAR